jgi:hypothetical protein
MKQKLIGGQAHSHIFRQGSRIKIKVTNLDNISNDAFLRTNPYVLPSLKRATDKIYVNGSNKSYLELPMIGFAIGVHNISSEVPAKFNLYQNYPNPFNPVTKIKFDVTASNLTLNGVKGLYVRLVVYDILGKEIAVLVDDELAPGTYEAEWNASGYPSGVYFYVITAGKFEEARKMVLTK